jgi:hypothetical protein
LRSSGDALVSASSDTNVKFWDIRHKESLQEFMMESSESMNAIDIHPEIFLFGWYFQVTYN